MSVLWLALLPHASATTVGDVLVSDTYRYLSAAETDALARRSSLEPMSSTEVQTIVEDGAPTLAREAGLELRTAEALLELAIVAVSDPVGLTGAFIAGDLDCFVTDPACAAEVDLILQSSLLLREHLVRAGTDLPGWLDAAPDPGAEALRVARTVVLEDLVRSHWVPAYPITAEGVVAELKQGISDGRIPDTVGNLLIDNLNPDMVAPATCSSDHTGYSFGAFGTCGLPEIDPPAFDGVTDPPDVSQFGPNPDPDATWRLSNDCLGRDPMGVIKPRPSARLPEADVEDADPLAPDPDPDPDTTRSVVKTPAAEERDPAIPDMEDTSFAHTTDLLGSVEDSVGDWVHTKGSPGGFTYNEHTTLGWVFSFMPDPGADADVDGACLQQVLEGLLGCMMPPALDAPGGAMVCGPVDCSIAECTPDMCACDVDGETCIEGPADSTYEGKQACTTQDESQRDDDTALILGICPDHCRVAHTGTLAAAMGIADASPGPGTDCGGCQWEGTTDPGLELGLADQVCDGLPPDAWVDMCGAFDPMP